jgi:hypothetical protein
LNNFRAQAEAFKAADPLEAADITSFIDFLMQHKSLILELPTSTKQSEFTIQRFYLFILPLFGLLHALKPQQAVDSFKKCFTVLLSSSFNLNIKFSA